MRPLAAIDMGKSGIRLYTLPNFVTLGNLFCGCLATLFALRWDDITTAFILIIIAGVLDFLDGFTARLLKSYSELGVQLDSLSDMVSFGVAPSAILYSYFISLEGQGMPEWSAYAVFVLALFSALRLAKFNIDQEQKEEFVGLPTPACAFFVASAAWLCTTRGAQMHPAWLLLATAIMSWLLVSPIRMFSLKFRNYSLRDNTLRYGFVLLSVIGIAIFQLAALPFIIACYVLVSILHNAFTKRAPDAQ